jgi:hypothetical protein
MCLNIISTQVTCRNPSLGLATKVRVCKVVGQEGSSGVMSHAPMNAKECEGVNPHTPKWTPNVGVGVATLDLGSQARQRLARLWAKREARKPHHMLSRVQRVWGNEPSHSQVNSHWELGSQWTPESSEGNCRGQNPLVWKVLYIIEKLLKCRCLRWACMTHLDIWNTIYGQKEGRESNWQFNSWPLKVENWPNFLAWRWHATYHRKALDEGYKS